MAQVVIRGLESEVVDKLSARAKESGRSLEAELRLVLKRAAAEDFASAREAVRRVRLLLERRRFPDSAALVREDRDR
ncbi:MAG: hypothetical protein FJX74_13050 [Armatimonadetes bacterium]|nr:hypothetical protein [Armatimonadota bacterium]